MSASELNGPIAQFQATVFEKEDIRRLVKTINQTLGPEKARQPEKLDRAFEAAWPGLLDRVKNLTTPDSRNLSGDKPSVTIKEQEIIDPNALKGISIGIIYSDQHAEEAIHAKKKLEKAKGSIAISRWEPGADPDVDVGIVSYRNTVLYAHSSDLEAATMVKNILNDYGFTGVKFINATQPPNNLLVVLL
jgi:hypothetical protein